MGLLFEPSLCLPAVRKTFSSSRRSSSRTYGFVPTKIEILAGIIDVLSMRICSDPCAWYRRVGQDACIAFVKIRMHLTGYTVRLHI